MTRLQDLLVKTSRTFALSIPRLPEPTRDEVTVAYLLFRIADTFEDAAGWSPERRLRALSDFSRLLGRPAAREAERLARGWVADLPIRHEGYLELLAESPSVVAAFRGLTRPARGIVRAHLLRTVEGMSGFVSRARESGEVGIRDLDDLRAYCYAVAGIVGEMLTELFLLGRAALGPVASYLRERARGFGEGLQLVNILRDATADLTERRRYLPAGLARSGILRLARHDLDRAAEYVLALQRRGAPRGLVAFSALPVLLARATLARVERQGPGTKLTRPEVRALVEGLDRALDGGDVSPKLVSGTGIC